MPTKSELEAQLAEAQALKPMSLFDVFTYAKNTAVIGARTMYHTVAKAERIIDISTDAVLHSAEYLDHQTRANLATVQAQKPLA